MIKGLSKISDSFTDLDDEMEYDDLEQQFNFLEDNAYNAQKSFVDFWKKTLGSRFVTSEPSEDYDPTSQYDIVSVTIPFDFLVGIRQDGVDVINKFNEDCSDTFITDTEIDNGRKAFLFTFFIPLGGCPKGTIDEPVIEDVTNAMIEMLKSEFQLQIPELTALMDFYAFTKQYGTPDDLD